MIADIRTRIRAIPFVPFTVRTTDGREYPVPTVDHIFITPAGGRVYIPDDEGATVVLTGLHICGLVALEPTDDRQAQG